MLVLVFEFEGDVNRPPTADTKLFPSEFLCMFLPNGGGPVGQSSEDTTATPPLKTHRTPYSLRKGNGSWLLTLCVKFQENFPFSPERLPVSGTFGAVKKIRERSIRLYFVWIEYLTSVHLLLHAVFGPFLHPSPHIPCNVLSH